MKHQTARWLLAVGLATAGTLDSAEGAEELTVDQAVALALANNRRVAAAELQAGQAEERFQSARTRRLPSLEVEGQAGTTITPVRMTFPAGSFGTPTETTIEAPRALSGSVAATLAQPITGLHRIGLATRLAELGRDAEREKVRGERANVAAEVRRLYYALLHGESALAAAEQQLEVYRELDRVTAEHVVLEVALQSDGMEVEARVAAEEYHLATLRGDLASSRERLNHLMGRDLAAEFELVAVPDASLEEVSLDAALARAIDRRPGLAQARLAVEQAETDRRMTHAESIPDVNLALTYTSYLNVDLLPSNLAQVGVQVKWEPFDWGRRRRERAEKAMQVQQARSTATEAESQARLEVSRAFRKLQEARLLLSARALEREAAAESLRVAATRYRAETVLLKDVLGAQAALSAAVMQHEQARTTYWTARADLQVAMGEEK